MNTLETNNRLDYLDAVRAFALLLGILFHAAMSFLPIYVGWAVMDISTSPIVAEFVQISHSFRMELFFLIAGFFSHMTFHRKGAKSFINSRLVRIGAPFVVGWFILKPLIVASWTMGMASLSGEVNVWVGLKTGFLSLNELHAGIFTGTHLWFLYYLIMVTAITLVLRWVVGLNSSLESKVKKLMDAVVNWIGKSLCSWFTLALPTAGCLWFMSIWGMETPDKTLWPNWPVLLVYGGCFGVGWMIHRQEGRIEHFSRVTPARIVLCLGSVGATVIFSGYQSNMGHPQIEWFRAGFVFSYAMMMWSLVCLSVGLFKRLFDQPNRVVRYVADSSYWLYLVHLPIVIWLQIAFAELPFHWSFKLAAIFFLTVGVSILLYDLFVRSTWIGRILNGRKKERALFCWRSKRATKVASQIAYAAE